MFWHQRKEHLVQASLSPLQASTNWDVTHPVWSLAFWLLLPAAIIGGVNVTIWWLATKLSDAEGSLVTNIRYISTAPTPTLFQLLCIILGVRDVGLLSHAVPGGLPFLWPSQALHSKNKLCSIASIPGGTA